MAAMTDAWDDRPIRTTAELAVFLGGSEDSFTGLLLTLIEKARATPVNMMRLEKGFPREVEAWKAWQSMPQIPTFRELREALDALDEPARRGLEMLKEAAAKADPAQVARIKAHIDAQFEALRPQIEQARAVRDARRTAPGGNGGD